MNADYFRTLAAYNRWANRRLYTAAAELNDADYRADLGAFFKSVHGTLNHILVGDRVWMARIEGVKSGVASLDQSLYDNLVDLTAAREAEDQRIIDYASGLSEADLAGSLIYSNMVGSPQETPMALVLGHMFNHQTHHRGHAHALISRIGAEPPELDLICFTRDPDFV